MGLFTRLQKVMSTVIQPNHIGLVGDFQHAPPYVFERVLSREFQVKACRETLKCLCDEYLNIDKDSKACWEPALPNVYIFLSSYGAMRGLDSNAGYAQQQELAFVIPVVDNDDRFAWFAPFLVVDNPLSMISGREVGGFSKAFGRFSIGDTYPWLPAMVETWVYANGAADCKFEPRTILTIESREFWLTTQQELDKTVLTTWPFGFANDERFAQTVDAAYLAEIQSGVCEEKYGKVGVDLIQFRSFRDFAEPGKASYHGLNYGTYILDKNYGGGSIVPTPTIKLYEYHSLKLAERFGLDINDNGELNVQLAKYGWEDFSICSPRIIYDDS